MHLGSFYTTLNKILEKEQCSILYNMLTKKGVFEMKRSAMSIFFLMMLFAINAFGLERPEMEFKIFQFPANMIPRIDGSFGW